MAKKQVNGQMNLFDYINSIQHIENFGDMTMTSLMPEEEPENEKPTEPEKPIEIEKPVETEKKIEAQKPIEVQETIEIEKPVETEKTIEVQESIEIEKSVESEKTIVNETDDVFSFQEDEKPVMCKYFTDANKNPAFVEYRNYNRVLIQYPKQNLIENVYDSSAEAVDAYINEMLKMSEDSSLTERK